ncbi:MAG: tRNA dihydrouridine synthase DusB [Rhodobacteraceae bacterium]|nr:MAG: tRNA dihydrouridine synthase DusB [Paracoccaceae bacterium]
MPLSVGNVAIPSRALLAPMAGITDLPFRRLAARFGAGLVVSEMLASREVLAGGAAARAKLELDSGPGVSAVQIAGCEAALMAEAARIAEGAGARIVDINMGCPAKKVVNGWSGSALMRAPDAALRLIEAVVAAVTVPVTLKMRLGWDRETMNAAEIARRAEAAGVAMITVHGRTRNQFYKGVADWAAIGAVKAAVRAPVVANGDIADLATARAALAASGADAVMIGRGAQGAPWVPAEIGAALGGAPFAAPSADARRDLLIEHYEAMLGFYGRDLGARVARKHLVWALSREPETAALRARIVRLDDPAAVLRALREGACRARSSGEGRSAWKAAA